MKVLFNKKSRYGRFITTLFYSKIILRWQKVSPVWVWLVTLSHSFEEALFIHSFIDYGELFNETGASLKWYKHMLPIFIKLYLYVELDIKNTVCRELDT